MRRTLEREWFPVSGMRPGEVLVTSSFMHPTRGRVSCPAAPVAAGAMQVTGRRLRHGPASPGGGDGMLCVVSYLDPAGHVVGLGIAAHRDDRPILSLADEVVQKWAEVMRTRRVLIAATGPSCVGTRREAVMIARVAGQAHLLADGAAPRPWPAYEVRSVAQLVDVPDGGTVVLPAHGVDRRTAIAAERAATTRGVRVVDATCPLVARTHATARHFAATGATVVVIGAAGHAALPSILGQAAGTVVVTSVEEVDELVVEDPDRVAFVLSPGLAVEDAAVIMARLRTRFGRPIGQHPDEFCFAASDRRAAVRAVASSCDLTLVLGDPVSDDARMLLADVAAAQGVATALADARDLRPEHLRSAASVGVVPGTSAGSNLVDDVVEVLSGLGPTSVSRRRVTTEVQERVPIRATDRQAG